MNKENSFKLFDFATGTYTNKCIDCCEEFVGDNRARQCLKCAIEKANKYKKEYDKLYKMLAELSFLSYHTCGQDGTPECFYRNIQEKIKSNKSLLDYCFEAYKNAKEKGFYEQERNIGELLMLIVSELSEALEAHRKNKFSVNYIPNNVENIEKFKDSFEMEIADCFIRLFDLCGYLNINIEYFIDLKMQYNAKREYKHGKRY